MRILGSGFGLMVLAAAMGTGVVCAAQSNSSSSRGAPPPVSQQQQQPSFNESPDGAESHDPAAESLRLQLAKARNEDRQKQLVQDTEKLLSLATELKTDVDKSSKDTLSIDVIRKADEIEKLAHSVKDKMKGP